VKDKAPGPMPRRSLHLLSLSTDPEAQGVNAEVPAYPELEHLSAETAAFLQTLLTLCQQVATASIAEFTVRAGGRWVAVLRAMPASTPSPSPERRSRTPPASDDASGRRHVVTTSAAPWFALSLQVQQAPARETARLLTQALALAIHVLRAGELLRREEESRRRVLDMQAELAHELRTPLTAISGFAQLLQRPGQLDEARRRNYAGIAVNESQQVTAIIDHLVAALQAESEALGYEAEQGDKPIDAGQSSAPHP
jgi:signal transduction histidine kinase